MGRERGKRKTQVTSDDDGDEYDSWLVGEFLASLTLAIFMVSLLLL